jgi:gas vesicle protein
MKDSGKIIIALLAGAAVGAAVGILLAPSSGAELREDIADYVNDLVESAKGKANNLREYGSSAVERSKSKFRSAVNNLADYKDEVAGNVRARAGNAAEAGKEVVEHAKSKVKGAANDLNDSIQDA